MAIKFIPKVFCIGTSSIGFWKLILETIEKGLKIHFSLTKPRPEAGCPGEAQCHAVCGGPQLLGLCGPPRQEVGPGHGEGLHHSDRAVR